MIFSANNIVFLKLEDIMSKHLFFSKINRNKATLSIQLSRIINIFVILVFLISAVGVKPAAAEGTLEVLSTTPDWEGADINSKIQVLFNQSIDLTTFTGSIDGVPIDPLQITSNGNSTVLTINPGTLEYEHTYPVVIDETVATPDGLSTLVSPYTFSFTVGAAVPVNDAYTTEGTTSISVNAETGVLANDPHASGVTLTAQLVVGPNNGELNLASDGSFTFTPNSSWSGRASFTYQAVGSNSSKSAIVTITNTTSVDPIPGYLAQVSLDHLNTVVDKLVTDYAPRHVDYSRTYIDDHCNVDTAAAPYSSNNYEMSADYVASLFTAMGYTVVRENVTLSQHVPIIGHNLIAEKTGSLYPNDYIEVASHLDSWPTTPGASDSASGDTAVIELARVLKNYPSTHSIRFILYVGHEHQSYNEGSMYHLDQVLARGERIKAGLIMDAIGWSEAIAPSYATVLWETPGDAASTHIAETYQAVAAQYGIPTLVKRGYNTYSENKSYIDHGMPTIANVGGNPYLAPGYHGFGPDYGCGDVLYRYDRQNVFISAQVALGVLIKLDQETEPEPSLRVVAAVGVSADTTSDTVGNFPMRAFDSMRSTFWSIATDNFGYTDKWLTADLGLPKVIDRIELDFGDVSSAIATDFQVWVGNDPTFTLGSYQVAANITDNTSNQLVLDVSPALTGRWVRYVVTRVVGATSYLDYSMREMRIYGEEVPITETKHIAVAGAATASSYYADMGNRGDPNHAFDGLYNNFWHPQAGSPLPSPSQPEWVQADLGSPQVIGRAIMYYYGGYALSGPQPKAVDFQIWVGNDPAFAPGSYTVATSVTNNDSYIVQVYFPEVVGRYLRYVVTKVKGTDPARFYDAIMYELEMWGPSSGVPVANNLSVSTPIDTPVSITLQAADPENKPLTYSVLQSPAHGNLTGIEPALVYTPESGYIGADSFTYQANNGTSDSNIATVNITVTPPQPLPVIAAVASSTEVNSDPLLKRPMNGFDGNPEKYWTMAIDNWGYSDKWLQADLGSTHSLTSVTLNWGTWGQPVHGKEVLAKDFQIWVGNDPTFPSGSYTVAASMTGFTDPDNDGILALPFASPVNGRWVRYVVSLATGTMYYDYALGEMQIYGSDLPTVSVKLPVINATAKSYYGTLVPSRGFDGLYETFWHVAQSDTTSPWWLQADLGSSQTFNRVLTNYNGGYGRVEEGGKAKDFQIWVGNDPTFTPGSYTLAATITGSDSWYALVDFPEVTGRYVRYVVSAVKGTDFYDPSMSEMEIWQTGPMAPAITQQPTNQTARAGQSVAFSARASGSPSPTVQWQVYSGTAWGDIPGATSTILSFTATAGDDGKQYRAIFTNSSGSAMTNPATFTINTEPIMTKLTVDKTLATASSYYGSGIVPANAFDGNMANFWHVAQLNGNEVPLPSWLQADLGSIRAVAKVEVDYGPQPASSGNIATNFEFWVGNDPSFAQGSFTVAAHITGNAQSPVVVPFAEPAIGRYIRYVVNEVVPSGNGHGWWSALMFEMGIWQYEYMLDISSAHGAVTKSPNQSTYSYGNEVTLSMTTDPGWTFTGWTPSLIDNKVTITGDTTVTANFVINTFTLAYSAGTGGSLTGETPQTVNYGEDGTAVEAVADLGYHFVDWSDTSIANPRTDTNVIEDLDVTANFAVDTFTLDYAAGEGGSLTGVTSQTVNYGADGTAVTAVADPGYHFVNWSDASIANPRTDTNVIEDLDVTANFALSNYSLNITKTGTGSGTVTSEPEGINCGATCSYDFNNNTLVTLSAAAASGSWFAGWSGEGCSGNGTCVVTMDAIRSVTATFFSPPSVVYVDDDYTSISCGAHFCGYDAFVTIQEGVAAVTADGTVNVAAGTYIETGQIVINKNLSILGADKATTFINPSANTEGESAADGRGWFLVNSGVTFNLSNVTLDGSGHLIREAIRSHGNGTIENCAITNIRYSQYLGTAIALYGGSSDVLNINNCEFSNIERVGILTKGPITGSFNGNTYTGKGTGDWLDYGIEIQYGAQVAITNNVISNNRGVASSDGSDSSAVTIWDDSGDQATITGNTFTNNHIGVAVAIGGYGSATDPVVDIGAGNLFDGGDIGIDIENAGNTGAPTVTFGVSIYKGQADSAIKLGDGISTGNTYDISSVVFKTSSGTVITDNIAKENLVYHLLDASNRGLLVWNGNNVYVTAMSGSIQRGIDAARAGWTVNVAAATYAESVIIDRGLTLQGAVGAIIAPLAGPGIQIDVSPASAPVTVDDFTITPLGSTLDSAQGIVIGSISSPVATHGITISNNTIITLGQNMGILVRGVGTNGPGYPNSSGLTVTDNVITLSGDSTAFYASWVTPAHTDWTISGNTFDSPIGVNLQLHDVDDVIVDNNIFKMAGSGGSTSVFFVAELSNLTGPFIFSNNDVQGSGANLVSFRTNMNTLGPSTIEDITVTGNTFDNWVVAADRQALGIYPRATTVAIHENYFLGAGTAVRNTSGVLIDATSNWWGAADGPGLVGPGTGALVSTDVDFTPWCGDAVCTSLLPQPSVVYINATYSDGSAGGHIFGYDAFATIQEGIAGVAAGGTVNVYAGTYAESVVIDRGLTLQGTAGANITPLAGPGIQIDVSPALNPVTVDGFNITPLGSALDTAQGIVIGSDGSPVATHGITISNNTITTLGQNMGILVRGVGTNGDGYPNSSGLTVTDNVITLNGDSTAFYASWVAPAHTNWNISRNTFDSPSGVNLELYDVDNLTVDNNIFKMVGSGVNVLIGAELNNLTGLIIFSNNDVQGNGSGSMVAFINDRNAVGSTTNMDNVTIIGNTFSGWVESGRALGIYPNVYPVGIHLNSFVGAGTALRNTNNELIDATSNWWGAADGPGLVGPGTGALVSTYVDYSPWCAVANCSRLSAALVSPSVTTVNWDKTYQWTGVSGATWYQLELREAGGAVVKQVWYTAVQAGCSDTPDCVLTPAVLAEEFTTLAPGDYQWLIEDYGAYGYGPWSDPMDFSVAAQCFTLAISVSGGNGMVDLDPTPACNGNTQYDFGTVVQLTATGDAGYTFNNWSGAASGSANPTPVTMNGDKSVTANFKPVSVLVSPSVSTVNWDKTYQWTGVSGATWYQLELREAGGAVVKQVWYTAVQAGCSDTPDCVLTPAVLAEEFTTLAPGDYQWLIEDFGDAYGYGPWSDPMDFSVAA
jgi:uncharacterized repeat protein (TIGR02543 family)